MKNVLKQIYFLCLVLSLISILANGNLNYSTVFHSHAGSHAERPNTPNHFEHSQSIHFGDDIFLNNSLNKLSKFYPRIKIRINLNFSFNNDYTSCIWRPPVFS